jgi:hypothetical protein
MASTAEPLNRPMSSGEASNELAAQWRKLSRAATIVAVLTSPLPFYWLYYMQDVSLFWSLMATFLIVVATRGLVDVGVRRFIPWPSLFGTDETRLKEEDVVNRRRAWYWSRRFRLVFIIVMAITVVWVFRVGIRGEDITWWGTAEAIWGTIAAVVTEPIFWLYAFMLPGFLLFNFLILFGPLMLVGITQMQAYEPGDADWGVKLGDVRGQEEAKEEVRRVVSLWQSGEAFERAGGKREPSPPASTARSSPCPAPASRRRSSAWTRSSSATWPTRRRSWRASGAASASSSSTRSTPSACGARVSGRQEAWPHRPIQAASTTSASTGRTAR